MKFSPGDEEAIYVHSVLWAQLGERCGAMQSADALREFLILHDSITQFASERQTNAFAKGLERGAAFQERLMRDHYGLGVVDTYRRICRETGAEVPAWAEALASEIEQRRAALRDEHALANAPTAADCGTGLVH